MRTIITITFLFFLTACGGGGGSTGDNTSNGTLVSISITPTNPSIAKGTSQQFIATGSYSDNTTKDLTTFVNWSLSNPAVAIISDAGLATTAGAGTTTIVAKDPSAGVSASTNLTVTNFKDGGHLKVARAYHSSALLKDGRVLVTGGIDNNGNELKSAEVYDPMMHTSVVISDMGTPKYNHQSVLLQNGDVLLIDRVWCSIELFQAASQTFKIITEATPNAYLCGMGRQATMLSDGRVMISGGERYDGQFYDTNNLILLYEPSTQTITYGYMQEYRRDHSATLLPSGQVVICGGRNNQNYHKSCEIYDPSANLSLKMSNGMYYERAGHSAILIGNKVIIVGGCSWRASVGTVCGSTEEYDISNNDFKFTFVGTGIDMHRYLPSVVYLPYYDKLYVVGGSSSPSGTWEPMIFVLDITNKTIQQLETLQDVGGGWVSVVQLSPQQFMLSGGYNSDNTKADLVKIFDPS